MLRRSVVANWRLLLIAAFLLMLFLILFGRMLIIQVLDVEGGVGFLQGEGDARVLREESIAAYRGMITDRNGQPLAVSTPVVSIYMNLQHLQASSEQLSVLSKVLGINADLLREKVVRYKNKQFAYIKRHVSPEVAEAVYALKIKGIYGKKEYRRYFPAGEVTSHLIGFTDINNKGLEGFEAAYDQLLRGEPGSKLVVKDLFRRTIKNVRQIRDASPGENLVLSIDLRLQYLAYRELKEAVVKHRADSGSIVILDVETFEVLAMVNQPAFNPNDRSRMDIGTVRNRAVTDVFEPGSTVKPFTMMAALETGKYTLKSKINTHPGSIKVGFKTYLDPRDYGEIDFAKVLAKSSQVGTIKIALSLEPDQLYGAFYRLGLGQFIGTGFPGESTGYLPNNGDWQPVDQAAFGFGAGLSVTALQLARAYAVLASGGLMRQIHFVKQNAEDILQDRIVDESVAINIQKMLKGVAAVGGTAQRARTLHYSVAGKTGTSHKMGTHGYSDSRYRALFAGFAPADKPRLVAVVVIEDPKGKEYYGGEVAAPIFSKLMFNSLRVLNVRPDLIVPVNVARSDWMARQ